MTLQASGQISINNIAAEFGGVAPHSLSEYYGVASGVPASGQIGLFDFYGKGALGMTYNSQTLQYSSPANYYPYSYGENSGIVKTADGGFIMYATYWHNTAPYTTNGYIYTRGLFSNLTYSGYTATTNTNIRFVSTTSMTPMKTVTNSAMIAWISLSGSAAPYSTSVNLARVSNTGTGAFTNSALSMATLSTGQHSDGLHLACNSADNVLVAYTLKANASPYNGTTSYVIRNSTCASVKAATSLASWTGANSKVMMVTASGTDFFVFYYSITNSAYGVVKINSNGSSHTNYTIARGTGITGHWGGNTLKGCAFNGNNVIFPYGNSIATSLVAFNTSTNTATSSPASNGSDYSINDGQSAIYVPDKNKYMVLQGRRFKIYSSTLSMEYDTTLSAVNGLDHYTGCMALRGSNELLLACSGVSSAGTGLHLVRYTV